MLRAEENVVTTYGSWQVRNFLTYTIKRQRFFGKPIEILQSVCYYTLQKQ